ncbi:SpoIIE family protein phosphatase [Solirubrobacter ginsenosidimutans]|uniref:SpoIIE family protein phosphatase n=1 Tax=Solirubrobacter ginsenosidimutans TaxID=490573 RepID=A0A9X3S6P4_9ACTN|nr:SpoIIE family protein phosphatase [Solirubrobacter ginsenosidimutans]MDA0162793.1 SpoIIE family protein phosphatase [Solirubrobacter ginsenosidimutans]
MRRPLGLRFRVLGAAGLIALVSLITFGVLLNGLSDQTSLAKKGRSVTDGVNAAATLERLALEMESSARGFVVTRDDVQREAFEHSRAAVPAASRRLLASQTGAPERARVTEINRQAAEYAAFLAGVVADPRADPAAAARQSDVRLSAFRSALTSFAATKRAQQMQLRADSKHLRTRATRIAIGGLVVLLVLIAVLAFAAHRAIVVPVNRLQKFARELGAGRFQTRLPEDGPPETAELAQAFNVSAERLERATERHLAELDAVFRDSPLGIAFLDLDLRFLRVNEALARMNQVPAAEHLGRTAGEVTGQNDVERALRQVVETGEPILDVDVALHGRRFEANYFPVRDDRGELLAVGKAMSDVTARRRAENARERLQDATSALASAVTVSDVAAVAIEQARGALDAEAAVLLLLDADRYELEIVSDQGLDDGARGRWGRLSLAERMPATDAARTATAIFISAEATLLERYPGLAGTPYPRAGAYASLPLVAYGRTLGVLSLGYARPIEFDADERGLLNALAAQTAIAIARAQLYEREHTVSQTLQQSLLPRALPEIPGLDIAGRLEAGAKGVEVGGDFYDAFAIGENAWGVAIGDVCGKGVDAAALTALARHTVRAAAHAHESPAAVLEALNRAVLDESRPGQFLTAIFARLTPRPGGGFRLRAACGGHPPPVVLDAAGRPRELPCAGTLLGVVDDPDIADSEVDLEPGDTLLLYTDGLTEAAAPQHTLTTAEVGTLLARVHTDTAEQTAQACLASAIAAGGGVNRDDVAVLVVQVSEPALDRRDNGADRIFDTGTMP